MASADELLREAQFAFQSIGAGSTDERKNTARAKRIARRIVRAYPAGIEAAQAREILRMLGADDGWRAAQPADSAAAAVNDASTQAYPFGRKITAERDGWFDLYRRFAALPYLRKRLLVAAVFFLVLLIGFTPFLLIFAVFYVYKPALVKEHLGRLLQMIHPEAGT